MASTAPKIAPATVPKKKVAPAAKKRVRRAPAPAPAPAATKQSATTAAKSASLHPVALGVAHIPEKSLIAKYIGRTFAGDPGSKPMTDMEVFDYCFATGMNLLIEGPTGPGKTMATRTWAAINNKSLARIPSQSGIDASQLFGKFNPDKQSGGFTWVDGPVTHVFRHGGVILWNEVNFTPERIASVMFGALDDNREIVLLDHDGEVIRAHRGAGNCWCDLSDDDCTSRRVLIVADMNPDYMGTRDLNAAFRNRFAMQLVWNYDPTVEAVLVKSEFLRKMAGKIRDDSGYSTPVSTNMLMEFEKIASSLSVGFALSNFINHFLDEERSAIRIVVDAHRGGITNDLNPPKPAKKRDEPTPDDIIDAVDPDDADVAAWAFTNDDD